MEKTVEMKHFVSETGRLVTFPDYLIKVDPGYEAFYPGVEIEEVENPGPSEYFISDITLWLHEIQRVPYGMIKIEDIYQYLVRTNGIDTCLGLKDFWALQKMPVEAFDAILQDKVALLLPKAVARDINGNRVMAVIYKDYPRGGIPQIRWDPFNTFLLKTCPTPRFLQIVL